VAKGLISESAAPTDEDAFRLVFLPGFSTKEVASSVSGRGVGMDVVRTAVEKNAAQFISIPSSGSAHASRFACRSNYRSFPLC